MLCNGPKVECGPKSCNSSVGSNNYNCACGNPPAGLDTFALWADPGHGWAPNHGKQHFFHGSSVRQPSSPDSGNHNKITPSIRWQANECRHGLSNQGGVGKLFLCFRQKQINPSVTTPLSPTASYGANVGGVRHCALSPWGQWQEVNSTMTREKGGNPFTFRGCLLTSSIKTVIWESVLRCWKHGIVTTCIIFILLWLRRTCFNFKQKPEHTTWNFLVLTQSLITSSFLLYTCSASPPTNRVPRFASCVTVLTYTVCVFHGPMFLWKPKLYLSGPEGFIGIHLITTADRLFHFYYFDSYTDNWTMTMSGFVKRTKILHYNQWPYMYLFYISMKILVCLFSV